MASLQWHPKLKKEITDDVNVILYIVCTEYNSVCVCTHYCIILLYVQSITVCVHILCIILLYVYYCMCMYTCCKSMCMYTYKYSTILQFFILWIDLTCIYNTMFDRDTLSFGTIIVMSKVALTAGSSQQGKARLASAGWKI